jgi:hypothetical protein
MTDTRVARALRQLTRALDATYAACAELTGIDELDSCAVATVRADIHGAVGDLESALHELGKEEV